jgi:hypothetical protein
MLVTYADLTALLAELEDIATEQELLANRGSTFAEESKRCASVAEALRLVDELHLRTFENEQRNLASRSSHCWTAFTSGIEAALAEGSLDEAQMIELSGHVRSLRQRLERASQSFRRVPEAIRSSILDFKTRFGIV